MEKLLKDIGDIISGKSPGALNSTIRAAVIILIALIVAKIFSSLFNRLEKRRRNANLKFGYVRVIKYILIAITYATAIAAIISGSAKQAVSAVLASSGIVAIVISIACQEPIGNLASGVIIILASPFKVGDVVRHMGLNVLGTVEEITLRHTVVRTFENKHLFIPNSDMNRAAIENANHSESRVRMQLEFMITYESDIEVATKVITNAILRHPLFDDAQAELDRAIGKNPVEVCLNRFEPSGMVLSVWVWVEHNSLVVRMRSDILSEVHKHFKYAKIRFAYPHIEFVEKDSKK